MIDVVVQRLRQVAGVFADRVWGAPALEAAYTQTLETVPAAYVLFMGDRTDPSLGDHHVLQTVRQTVGVAVVLDNQADTPGVTPIEQALGLPPLNQVINVREALWYALLAWSPDRRWDPFTYGGSTHLKFDAAIQWHLYLFERRRTLSDMAARPEPDVPEAPVDFLRFAPEYRVPTVTIPLPGAPLLASDLIHLHQD